MLLLQIHSHQKTTSMQRNVSKIISEVLKRQRLDTALDEKISQLFPYEKSEISSSKFSKNIQNSLIDIARTAYKAGYKEGFKIGATQIADWFEENSEDHFVEPNEKVEDDYVDLGLPSGTLWASCNVGAKKPEEYGGYFTHDEAMNQGVTLPTRTQIIELRDECTNVWTTQGGVEGRLFTGPNGNTLFLPAAGDYYEDRLIFEDNYGYYWSSSPDIKGAYLLYFNADCVGHDRSDLYYRHRRSVRAVKNKEE